MSEPPKKIPAEAAQTPAGGTGEDRAQLSKKGAKEAEAKAKKEVEKA